MTRYTINWDGIDYPVPEKGFFEFCEQLEDCISVPRILEMQATGNINFARLARPAHMLLTYCGVPNPPAMLDLKDHLLAEGMDRMIAVSEGREPDGGLGLQIVETIAKILMGDAPSKMKEGQEAVKKTKPRSPKAATKSRSGSGASRRIASGK